MCSYRVRGVDGSCAEHLTVESYTVIYALTVVLIIINFLSPTHSFIPGLKPSFPDNYVAVYCSLVLNPNGHKVWQAEYRIHEVSELK